MAGDNLTEQSHELLFGIRRSARYHEHRWRFYELWTTVTVTVSLLGGILVAAVSIYFPSDPWLPAVFGGVIALMNVTALSVGVFRKANLHANLLSSFVQLESRFPPGFELTEEEYNDIHRERLVIQKTEPPVLRLLDVICHFEILRAMGYQYEKPAISLSRRILARFLSQSHFAEALGNGSPH